MPDLQKKVFVSLKSAALFVLLNLPVVYQATHRIFGNTWDVAAHCPTPLGIVVHAGVFFLLSYLMMRSPGLSKQDKIKHALTGALIFAVLSSAPVYRFVASLLGPSIASPNGCPSTMGIVVHGLVFTAILVGLMSIKA